MLAVTKAEHLNIGDADTPASWCQIAGRTVKDAIMRAAECALLDCHVVYDVQPVNVDMRVRKCSEPAAEELDARSFAITVDPTRRIEYDVL